MWSCQACAFKNNSTRLTCSKCKNLNKPTRGVVVANTLKRYPHLENETRDTKRSRMMSRVEQADEMLQKLVDLIQLPGTRKCDLKELLHNAARRYGREVDLVNMLHRVHDVEGRTPLAYAVIMNKDEVVKDLVSLGARLDVKMGDGMTVLKLAATNPKRDGTEMLRLLLSMGADPAEFVLDKDQSLNITMQYWIKRAQLIGRESAEDMLFRKSMPPMHRIPEIQYALVGQYIAIEMVSNALTARFANPMGQSSPLVLMLVGPPGHGKTVISRNTAKALVGEDNYLEIACGNLRDDADLFGSNLGGIRRDKDSDGQLTAFLRPRQTENVIVCLDEFEKVKDLTSCLGWKQDKKMYQSFLEAWQEGTLTDQSSVGKGRKLDVSRVVWILTSNWGQEEILAFADEHKEKVYGNMDDANLSWIKRELIKAQLEPLVMGEFANISPDLKALSRRINSYIPFLPFTNEEQLVIADSKLRARFQLYREPAARGTEDKPIPRNQQRLLGNVNVQSTSAYIRHVAGLYDPMYGADSFSNPAIEVDVMFVTKMLRHQLGLNRTAIEVTRSEHSCKPADIPHIWVHFDKDTDEVKVQAQKPVDAGRPLELLHSTGARIRPSVTETDISAPLVEVIVVDDNPFE